MPVAELVFPDTVGNLVFLALGDIDFTGKLRKDVLWAGQGGCGDCREGKRDGNPETAIEKFPESLITPSRTQ